jgi:NitT/TauT family transport system permease protein
MISITSKTDFRFLKKSFAVLFWILLWQVAAQLIGQEILLVSPVSVARRIIELIVQSVFWQSITTSIGCVCLGFLLGVICGTILAYLTTRFSMLDFLFYPLLSVIKATPVASFIILALVWLSANQVPILASFLMVLPIIWSNLSEGILKIDRDLDEVTEVFSFPKSKKFFLLYLPSVLPYFSAACTTALGLAWKAGVAAEVLANAKRSIGGNIYASKIYLETTDLFSWTVVVVILSVIFEKLILWSMKKILQRFNLQGIL